MGENKGKGVPLKLTRWIYWTWGCPFWLLSGGFILLKEEEINFKKSNSLRTKDSEAIRCDILS